MATTIGRWTRHNLFASPSSSLLSLVSIPLTIYVGFLIARWAFLSAHWAVVADNLAGFVCSDIREPYGGQPRKLPLHRCIPLLHTRVLKIDGHVVG